MRARSAVTALEPSVLQPPRCPSDAPPRGSRRRAVGARSLLLACVQEADGERVLSGGALLLGEPDQVLACDNAVLVLAEQVLDAVRRLGKRIVLAFHDDRFLVLHLMIAGRLRWREPGAKAGVGPRMVLAALNVDNDLQPLEPEPLPPRTWRQARSEDLSWAREYLVPWVLRRIRHQSSGDHVTPKRPEAGPFLLSGD